ncbi:hypothetical protein Rleg10DRAFT_5121 [Rhizobium leguminosarum bv. trifolii WSM2012]|nr:hypothetical protein Rleg10DRAFT_3850 [Rhizobium leguminosarum bv. trifolii WSM2012]EJC76459.1 hypothetical protein Rleg10DRAFT_5121 [Rhizobium leguminosarum bv. trifolii WSM2012]
MAVSRPDLSHRPRIGGRRLSLPGLAGGIASVSFSLAGGLVFNNPRDPGIFGRLSRLDLRCRYCLDGCLLLSRKGLDPGALLILQSFPFRTARLARFNKRDALSLPGGL